MSVVDEYRQHANIYWHTLPERDLTRRFTRSIDTDLYRRCCAGHTAGCFWIEVCCPVSRLLNTADRSLRPAASTHYMLYRSEKPELTRQH